MNEFLKSRKFKLIIGIIIVLVVVMLASAGTSSAESGTGFFGTIFKPIRQLTSSISNKLTGNIDVLANANDYRDENEELKKQISELYGELADYEDTKRELEELQKFIGIKEEHEDYSLSPPCTIIGRVTNDPFGSFIIDRGSKDDISLYDPVVTAEGLVGVITEIAPGYSTVRTLLSPELSVGGISIKSLDTGVVQGSIAHLKDGLCKMTYIDKTHDIKFGDVIVASGKSGLFPQGYLIGTVTETGREESGLSAYAIIKPFVDPESLTSVMVITDFDGQGEEYED